MHQSVFRIVVRHATGFLWRFQWFRLGCVVCVGRGWFNDEIGRYTAFWWAMRTSFLAGGHYDLAAKYGEIERRYEREESQVVH